MPAWSSRRRWPNCVHLADDPAYRRGLSVRPCPVDLDPLVQAMWWHPAYDSEPEHQLLREVVRAVVRDVFPPGDNLDP
ncbi:MULTISPECIES: type 2 periplasmic-binding domain-containing protein [Nocardia]|uniref:Uncharacterized protein n=1 Tax=Nocardia implantans TaxID=3108168 RepID=A0ABU6APG3_9NOCA|nr:MULTISPECIES: hypothetical protein [unclassified Nocardia]MBF6189702.1 hypothetical protein [Nocardia beijingensis]MEA3527068.1 hypothetical protein [Nocardia sp. CDC192]MEB3509354.1 hypothetical protein [Nocardia sp. CDC186]